jgi:hypothetical protein
MLNSLMIRLLLPLAFAAAILAALTLPPGEAGSPMGAEIGTQLGVAQQHVYANTLQTNRRLEGQYKAWLSAQVALIKIPQQ